MTEPSKPKATEERLAEIRQQAADGTLLSGQPDSSGAKSAQNGEQSYYGLPALKEPTWTWEVPLYFFLGGIAGLSACIAFFAQVFGKDPALIRAALWMALIGAGLCPGLLIADLGRPTRFLNMLRVFKLKSPMSMGAWILVAFSGCAFFAVASNELVLVGYGGTFMILFRWAAEFSGVITGFLLAGYTGVLLGATAIPVWSENRVVLPPHFLTSGLGCSSGILELLGFLIPATQIIGFVVSGLETLLGISFAVRKRPANRPLHSGRLGVMFSAAEILEGPLALGVRIFAGSSANGRHAAAICFIVGALLSRYAWIWAGRVSARDPQAYFETQRQS
ncbi:MAG TPA: NrfD/PsrC family molybdoenzyme membrane anchor subunit [Candidatus Acidoferrales bacterium]